MDSAGLLSVWEMDYMAVENVALQLSAWGLA